MGIVALASSFALFLLLFLPPLFFYFVYIHIFLQFTWLYAPLSISFSLSFSLFIYISLFDICLYQDTRRVPKGISYDYVLHTSSGYLSGLMNVSERFERFIKGFLNGGCNWENSPFVGDFFSFLL